MNTDIMKKAEKIQESIHDEISYTIKQSPHLSYQDVMNTCLIFRLALLQEQIDLLNSEQNPERSVATKLNQGTKAD